MNYFSGEWLWEQRDKRMDMYTVLMHPKATIALSSVYVVFVVLIGPWIMRTRKPYELQKPLIFYNLLQILISGYLVFESWDAGWGTRYSWTCQAPEPGTGPLQLRAISVGVVYLYNRYIQLFDTLFFIARKKYDQVTVLHVYHHAIMPIYAWTQSRFLPSNHETFIGVFNSFVHIFVYAYYLLSILLGSKIRPYLWFKKYITLLELIMFVVGISRSLIVITGIVECGYPWVNSLLTLIFIYTPFFYLFLEFYKKKYNKRK